MCVILLQGHTKEGQAEGYAKEGRVKEGQAKGRVVYLREAQVIPVTREVCFAAVSTTVIEKLMF